MFRSFATATVALVALGVVAAPRVASAQAVLERLDPAERGSRFFVADSLELDGDLRVAAGVVTSYGNRLRTFRQAGSDPEQSKLVEHSVWIHPGASLVMQPGVRFALDFPVVLQGGQGATLDRAFNSEPASPRIGDARLSFDVRLAGRERPDVDGAVLAAGVSAYLPTGSASDYTSDDFARVALRLATTVQLGPLLGAARVGYMYRRGDNPPFAGVQIGSEVNAVLALGYRRSFLVVGPELAGSTFIDSAFQRTSTPVEALLGVHVMARDVQLGLGFGTFVVSGLGAARVHGVLSAEWAPASYVAHDRDHDGVLDADDLCPDVPGLADAPLGARGCPAPPRDSDGDGVVDPDDACPNEPGARTGSQATNGCPAPPPAAPAEDTP